MSPFLLIFIGLVVVGIGVIQLIQGKSSSRTPQSTEQIGALHANDAHNSISKPESEVTKENPTSILGLEEAISLAIEDGKLSQREEMLLRKKALLAGKDPDELIFQIREDLIAMNNPETFLINNKLRESLDFEKYVVQKFNPKFFRLDQWEGDKFIAGRYASTTLDPDIQVTLNTTEGRYPIAVECKWRSKKEGDFIWFAEDKQLQRYQRFAKKTGKPTFIILGLGGKPSNPEEVFLIPVHAFKRGTQHHASLTHYRKPNPEQGFFFDVQSGELM